MPVLMTPDALQPCWNRGIPYIKHLSADGTQQLYGTFMESVLSLSATGTVRAYDSVSEFRTINLTDPQPPHVTCVVNAASLVGQAIAPGETITIFGPGIGPDQPRSYQVTPAGTISTNLEGIRVPVGDLAAPILYASKNQINAIVPFAAPIQGDVTVAIVRPGAAIGSLTTTAAASAPGIFTLDCTGTGQGAIFNHDGTPYTPSNPAAKGSTVTVYVTGLGPMSPIPADGSTPSGPTSKPTLPVQLSFPAEVLYIGDAPGLPEGVQQISIQLPRGLNLPPGSYALNISAGPNTNPASNWVRVSF